MPKELAMKKRKFQITFSIEVDEQELKGLAAGYVLEKVVSMVEETWDAGQDARKEEKPNEVKAEDSYGFEAEEIE